MSPERPQIDLLRAPGWLSLGVPVCAALLLVAVEVGDLNTRLFFALNTLPQISSPAFWAHLTILGDGLVCAVLLLPWIRRHPERTWGGLLGAVAMFLILRLFKGLWGLPRPLGVLPEELVNIVGPGHKRGAFPSGHTATFFLVIGIWGLSTRNRVLSLALVAFGILVGVSRIAVGVHWPSDILGGIILGWGTAWLGLRWAGRFRWGTGLTGTRVLGVLLLISAVVLFLIDHTGYPGVFLFQRVLAGGVIAFGTVELVRLFKGDLPSRTSDGHPGH